MLPILQGSHRWLRPGVVAGATLALCLGLTGVLYHDARLDAAQEAQATFDTQVRELINRIDRRMQTYVQVLYGAQGLFASSERVSREEFHTYMAGQQLHQRYPGIHGVGYMPLVTAAQAAAFTAGVRAEGFPDFSIEPAGERPLYAPITFLEPFNGSNLRAFGYDSLSEARRRAALEQARDSGMPAMSGKVRLRQETMEPAQSGFLVALPVYRHGMPLNSLQERRAALQGWVYAPFRIGDVMGGLEMESAARLQVQIYDGELVMPSALMYDNMPDAGGSALSAVQKVSIAGHRWTVRLEAMPALAGARYQLGKPELIAVLGTLLGVLMAGMTWLLARSRLDARQALARARELTDELKAGQSTLLTVADGAQRSQAMLRSILDSTVDGILVDDLRGTVLNSNRRFRELWNVPEQLDWDSDGAALLRHMEAQLAHPELNRLPRAGELSEERRELLRLRDGRVIEQTTRAMQLGNEQARLRSFRDMTERTQIEQREQTRRQVLELLATGAPLPAILEAVVRGVEAGGEGMLCSILLLDEDGEHFSVGAAPSLPPFFNAAVQGVSIHSNVGSCCPAALTGKRVIVEDISTDPGWRPFREVAAKARLGACWSEPILNGEGKVLGTFAIYHATPQRPNPAHLAQIDQAAHLAGIAIEQAQAAQALHAGEARFRSLYDNAPVALWEQDWSALRAALGELKASGVSDIGRYLQANPSVLPRLAGLVKILDLNAAALVQVGADPEHKQLEALSLAQIFDAAAMPRFGEAVAALAAGRQLFVCEGSFQRLDGVSRLNELTLLVMPGHTQNLDFVIASTLDITERKRMNDELLVLATTDFLTGLPNRREFMQRLNGEQARLQRDIGGCAAVLLLDLDHFKRVNDEYGHAAGDAVLRHLAALMRDCQRKVDMPGRVGGEEFAILLPGTDLAAAAVFAERLRQRIADSPVPLEDGRRVVVTASIGIAAMCGSDAAGEAALSRADQALYRAKRGGRNRVEVMPAGEGERADRPGSSIPAASD